MNKQKGFIKILIPILIILGVGTYIFLDRDKEKIINENNFIENQPEVNLGNFLDGKYHNQKYQIRFDISGVSDGVTVKETDNKISINGLLDIAFPRLEINPNVNGATLESEYQKCVNYQFTDDYGRGTIGGLDSFWCSTTEMGTYYSVVVTDQYIYKFNNFGLWEQSGIIDTFEFTN